MIWLWHICFRRTVLALALTGWPAVAGTVGGQVQLLDSHDPGVRKHRNYAGVVVWLEPIGRPAPRPAPRTAVILQQGKRFVPHILAVTVGSTVEFPNRDPIFHNAFSNSGSDPFDTGLYPPGSNQKAVFRREGIQRVFCNIHSSMSAVIVVLRTPYFAVTDAAGVFHIPRVPPGEYELRVWHERATEATLRALSRKVLVDEEGDPKVALRLSESGYLEVPHKNKYGQDYPPEPLPNYGGPSAP